MNRDLAQLISTEDLERERRQGCSKPSELEFSRPLQHVSKRPPRAGCYPLNYSPFKMTTSLNSSVGLNHLEIKQDKNRLLQMLREEFKSVYFEEAVCPKTIQDLDIDKNQLEAEDRWQKEIKPSSPLSFSFKKVPCHTTPHLPQFSNSCKLPPVPTEKRAADSLPGRTYRQSFCLITKSEKAFSRRNRKTQGIFCWKPKMR
eukprot:765272-Hanusia_phi.AAC.4